MWTRRLGYDLYNAYPIYDWTTEDIWAAYARFKWPFNQMYELYYKAGVPLDRQRAVSYTHLDVYKRQLNKVQILLKIGFHIDHRTNLQ